MPYAQISQLYAAQYQVRATAAALKVLAGEAPFEPIHAWTAIIAALRALDNAAKDLEDSIHVLDPPQLGAPGA